MVWQKDIQTNWHKSAIYLFLIRLHNIDQTTHRKALDEISLFLARTGLHGDTTNRANTNYL